MRTVDKVCPIVFRDSSMQQILAFEHPQAGVQLVKGAIGRDESLRAAALRGLPESWTYHCVDRGGRQFRFFWHDVNQAPGENWRPHYRRALTAIRERTRPLRWRG